MDWTQVSQAAGVAISGLISWGIVESINWIKAKTQAAKYANAASKIENLATTIVAGYMPQVKQIKNDNSDGVIPQDIARTLQQQAVDHLSQMAGDSVKHVIAKQGPHVEQYLKASIEQALAKDQKFKRLSEMTLDDYTPTPKTSLVMSGWLTIPKISVDLWETVSTGKVSMRHLIVEGAWDVWQLNPKRKVDYLIVDVSHHRTGQLRCLKQCGSAQEAYRALRSLLRGKSIFAVVLGGPRYGLLSQDELTAHIK